MINKQRVQRIRTIIYTIIVLLFFIPVILLIVLSIQMISLLKIVETAVDEVLSPPSASQMEPAPSLSGDGWEEQAPAENQGQFAGPEADPAGDGDAGDAPESADDEQTGGGDTGADTGNTQGDGDDTPPDTAYPQQPAQEPSTLEGAGNANTGQFVFNSYTPTSHPNLYFENIPVPSAPQSRSLYLTFDNTPAAQAREILSVLHKHDVRATFFVWWNEGIDTEQRAFLRELAAGGHQIGIQCGNNLDTYSQMYSSPDYFLQQFEHLFQVIYEETGVRTRLYRLPGGSVNPHNPQRQAVLAQIKRELDARGFVQHDWDASAQDAVSPALSTDEILGNLRTTVRDSGQAVVLLHDGTGSSSTTEALDIFIEEYKSQGYAFDILQADTAPVSFLDSDLGRSVDDGLEG